MTIFDFIDRNPAFVLLMTVIVLVFIYNMTVVIFEED